MTDLIEVRVSSLRAPSMGPYLRSNNEGRRIYQCFCSCGQGFEASKKDFNSGRRRACIDCRPPTRHDSSVSRIMKQVEIVTESGCWIWMGKTNDSGYAVGKVNGREQRLHRFMFSEHIEDPGELMVLHKCDTRPCINPDHLFKGTAADNIHDCMRKGRFMPGIAMRERRKKAARLGALGNLSKELSA